MNKLTLILLAVLLAACANTNKKSRSSMSNEPFLIYKTKADYNQKVPVILNADKTVIVSYPAPSDLKSVNGLRIPTELAKGYLLDNKGIGLNVAFTSYNYKEYAAMNEAPSIEQFMKSIVDNDPLLELYDCSEYLNIKYNLKEVNRLVKSDIKNCVKVK